MPDRREIARRCQIDAVLSEYSAEPVPGTGPECSTVRSADEIRLFPVRLLLMTLPGRINRDQQQLIEYLVQRPPDAVRGPNANPYAKRFVCSIPEECLDRLIFFRGWRLLHVPGEFVAHHHEERNHQGSATT
jgi:hypothetical protein